MSDRTPGLDLLALAEDVVEDRRTLSNVIDQIAVAIPDDVARRRAVAELQSLVVAMSAVQSHARATADVRSRADQVSAPAGSLLVEPRRVVARRRSRIGLGGLAAAGATALAGVVVVAIAVAALRPTPSVGGPSPSASPVPSLPSSPTPTAVLPATPVLPPSTVTPSPIVSATPGPSPIAAAGLPAIAPTLTDGPEASFWSLMDGDRIQTWLWRPGHQSEFFRRLVIETWPGTDVQRTVLTGRGNIAVLETKTVSNAPVQRLRVFDPNGELLWTAPRLPPVTAMAWSPDGTALAVGSLPVPWTVVQFNRSGAPDVTTYNLDDQDGYALLGFSQDGNSLLGYGTGGESEFFEKPILVDRARGRLTHLDAFPTGPAALSRANSTAPVDQIDGEGEVVAIGGAAKGDPYWMIRKGAHEMRLSFTPDAQLAWSGSDGDLLALVRQPVDDPNGLRVQLVRWDPLESTCRHASLSIL